MKNILVISSFMADTYSNIEKIYIKMSEDLKDEFNFIWLVRDIDSKYERYKNESLRGKLKKAKYVEKLEEKNIQTVVGQISKYNIIANIKLFRKLFKQYDIDAVYAHFHFEKYMACFFGKLFGKKVFYNEHIDVNKGGKSFKNKIKIAFFNIFSDRIIAVSNYIGRAYNKNKVRVVHNAVNIEDFTITCKNTAKQRLGYDVNKKNILMVAAFRPEKRHDLAFKIVEKVLENRDDIIFSFAGDGELINEYKNLDIVKKYPDNIIFLGHKLNIADYYNSSDISINTSQGESFGYFAVESMAYRVPVIAFKNTGGPDEIIRDGIDGYLIEDFDTEDFAQKILALIQDDSLIEQMGENGRENVEQNFPYSKWIQSMRDVFRSVFK